jgi:hypothetical protein
MIDLFFGKEGKDQDLRLGMLYYDERIGTAALSGAVQVDEGFSAVRNGLIAHTWSTRQTLQLKQRTWVRVFPDAGHLADAAEDPDRRHKIPMSELSRRGAGRVVASLLQAPILGGA